MIGVLTLDATINDNAPAAYRGLDRFVARKKVVADLEAQGLLVEVKKHKLMVPRCARTGQIVEPMLTDQWFVAMTKAGRPDGKSIAQKAIDAVESGAVKFVPEQWVNTYNQWMNNIQDWCISRQLWWGHQIPAWYGTRRRGLRRAQRGRSARPGRGRRLHRSADARRGRARHLVLVGAGALLHAGLAGEDHGAGPVPASQRAGHRLRHHLLLGRPDDHDDHALHRPGAVPPRLHPRPGARRAGPEDEQVRRQRARPGGPDRRHRPAARCWTSAAPGLRKPETAPRVRKDTEKEFPDGIPAYGADALRFTFAALASLGRNINFDTKRCEGYRNFCNKLWNATRFVLMNCEGQDEHERGIEPVHAATAGPTATCTSRRPTAGSSASCSASRPRWRRLRRLPARQRRQRDLRLRLGRVLRLVPRDRQGADRQPATPAQQRATRRTLIRVLETVLRLLHPMAPFITAELWEQVAPVAGRKAADRADGIVTAPYPQAELERVDAEADAWMAKLKAVVGACRQLRSEMNLSPAERVPLLVSGDADLHRLGRAAAEGAGQAVRGAAARRRAPSTRPRAARRWRCRARPGWRCRWRSTSPPNSARLAKEIARLEGEIVKAEAKLDNAELRGARAGRGGGAGEAAPGGLQADA